jgi:hypothetical protein
MHRMGSMWCGSASQCHLISFLSQFTTVRMHVIPWPNRPHLLLVHRPVGNLIIPSSPFQLVPLLQIILPLHPLYHHHHQLPLRQTLTDSLVAMLSANRAVVRSKSDGESFTSTIWHDNGDNPRFSNLPLQNITLGLKAAGLQQSSTVPSSEFSQDFSVNYSCGLGATSMDAARSFHFGLIK